MIYSSKGLVYSISFFPGPIVYLISFLSNTSLQQWYFHSQIIWNIFWMIVLRKVDYSGHLRGYCFFWLYVLFIWVYLSYLSAKPGLGKLCIAVTLFNGSSNIMICNDACLFICYFICFSVNRYPICYLGVTNS